MRKVGLRALLVGVVSLGLAWAARAIIASDRFDLVDVQNGMAADKLDSPLALNDAFVVLQAETAFASGSVNNGGNSSTFAGIRWSAFEPDQTKRSTSGGSLQQRDEVALVIFLGGAQVFSGVVPGCKAKVQVKAPKGSLSPPDIEKGQWSVSCNKHANDTLQLTDQQIDDLRTALGKKVVGKDSLKIKGKCTDANCLLPPA